MAGYSNRLVLAWTKEYVNLVSHNRLAARVEGKSSLARLGLGVHVTAPTIHAGFGEASPDGIPLQLEIWNMGRMALSKAVFWQHREAGQLPILPSFANSDPSTVPFG